MPFQETVQFERAFGVPGEIFLIGPTRAQPAILNSDVAAYNIVGATAYTVLEGGTDADPNLPISVKAGGTGVFAGILANPKVYASYGNQVGGPLAPTLTLPNEWNVELLQMGQMIVTLDNIGSVGDAVTYDPVTGRLSSIAATTSFTGTISTTVLTVSAIAAGQLSVGSQISGPGVTPGTYITTLGTGLGGTGTYTLNVSQTVGSPTAMTAPNRPLAAVSLTGHIDPGSEGDTILTVTAISTGQVYIGMPIVGVGVATGTVVTAFNSGNGGVGTYTVNIEQTVASETMTSPTHVICPNTFVDRYQSSEAGLTVIKMTN